MLAILYFRGRLARVHTIHAARWVFLDGGRRVLFASNYDGSLESYMDDFINKVAFGLNLAFSNGVGYPSTEWLVLDGARNEQKFKSVLRRHQLPTRGLVQRRTPDSTAHHLERNARLRRGLESNTLSDGSSKSGADCYDGARVGLGSRPQRRPGDHSVRPGKADSRLLLRAPDPGRCRRARLAPSGAGDVRRSTQKPLPVSALQVALTARA